MAPKYLFIDDETGKPTRALLDGFNDTKQIIVEALDIEKKEPFESVCGKMKRGLENNQYDGILIDLCLDGTGANCLSFKAQPFAQQIRTLASEVGIPHVPVVLCSTIEKKNFYNKDSASHDLFDYYINKTDIDFKYEAIRMQSLVKGYQLLNKKGVTAVEYLNRTEMEGIENVVGDYLSGARLSPYDIAHRIIKDVFNYPGLLIEESVLSARMGVDVKASGDGWRRLLDVITDRAAYTGVFSEGWPLYWSDKVNGFFMEVSGSTPFQVMNAKERVELLGKVGFKGLVDAKPILLNKSTYFDTVCESCHCPLDSMEGIPIEDNMSLKPWQQNHFVSFYAISKGDFEEDKICQEGLKKKNEIKVRIENEQAKGK